MNTIIPYRTFWDWLSLYGIILWRLIQVTYINDRFFLIAECQPQHYSEYYFMVPKFDQPFICWKTSWLFIWGLLQIELIRTFVCRFLCKSKLLFIQDKWLGVQLLGWTVVTCLIFLRNCHYVVEWLHHFTFPWEMHEPFCVLSWSVLVLSLFFTLAFLEGARWYLIAVFIWISLRANDGEHLCMCLFAYFSCCVQRALRVTMRGTWQPGGLGSYTHCFCQSCLIIIIY